MFNFLVVNGSGIAVVARSVDADEAL